MRDLGRATAASEERLLWLRLRDAPDAGVLHQSWLALQCRFLDGAVAGGLFLESGRDRELRALATWPQEGARPVLELAARRARDEGRGIALELDAPAAEPGDAPRCVVAQPVRLADGGRGIVAIEVAHRSPVALEQTLRRLAWGTARLELEAERARSATAGRLESLLQLVAAPLEHDRFRTAATAFASELASLLSCDRVSFGTFEGRTVTVRAVSHSAQFAERANLTRAVEAAMNEALDQEGIVVWPPPGGELPGVARGLVTRAHERLAAESRARSLCSVPLAHGSRFCGAVTCERGDERPFEAAEIELLEAAVALAGPLLDIQRRDDRWIGPKILEAARGGLAGLFGAGHQGAKLVAGLATCVLLFLTFARAEFRVSADATLEAEVLRAAVAPFDGYVLEAPVRAGDTVKAGDLLARLDDRDLVLERARWSSELLQLEPQVREAMAQRNVSALRALKARIGQARAQLALADGRLDRTRLVAAFDGVVATGDLSQRLGAPVNRGDVLFEVAPLDAYRLALEVDEKDIEELRPGQRGELLFTALPGDSIGFEVSTITPVSHAGEGRNAFRVEARLDETPPRLRPGMEGVAKVEIGRRRLLWIATREAVDWLRLAAWRWLP